MKTSRIAYTGLLLLCLLSACAGTATQRYYSEPRRAAAGAEYRAAQLKRDSARAVGHGSDMDVSDVQPPFVIATPPKSGLFSGVGKLFSTAEGVAHRRAVELAKASAPKIGKKAQGLIQTGTGNSANQSATGKKGNSATGEDAKVAVAGKNSTQATDSATATATGGGAAAIGAGASASGGAAPVEALSPLAVIANNATAWIPYAAGALLLAGAGYLFVLWRKKKQAQNLIS